MAKIALRNHLGPIDHPAWNRMFREFDRRMQKACGRKSFLLSEDLYFNADFWSLIGKKVGIRGYDYAPSTLAIDGSECIANKHTRYFSDFPIYDHAPFTETAATLTTHQTIEELDLIATEQQTPYNTLLGSLEAHSRFIGDKRYFLTYRLPFTLGVAAASPPQRLDTLSVVDAIVDGMDEFTWPRNWDKYNCFRIHNLQPRVLTIRFATGGSQDVAYIIPPWECRAIRRAPRVVNGEYTTSRYGQSMRYFFPFRKDDIRYLAGIGDSEQGFMLANNVCRPTMIVEWMKALRAEVDPLEPGTPTQEDLSLFGVDATNPGNAVGNLFYHRGKFWSIKWDAEAIVDKRELEFIGFQNFSNLLASVGATLTESPSTFPAGTDTVITGDAGVDSHDFIGHKTNVIDSQFSGYVGGAFSLPPLLWSSSPGQGLPWISFNTFDTVSLTASNSDMIQSIRNGGFFGFTSASVTNVTLRYSPIGPIATMNVRFNLSTAGEQPGSVYYNLQSERVATGVAGAVIDPQTISPAWPLALGPTVDRYHRLLSTRQRVYGVASPNELENVNGGPQGASYKVGDPSLVEVDIQRAGVATWTGTPQTGVKIEVPEIDNLRQVVGALDGLTWAQRTDAVNATGQFNPASTGFFHRVYMADWNMLAWLVNGWKRSEPVVTGLNIPFLATAPFQPTDTDNINTDWGLTSGFITSKVNMLHARPFAETAYAMSESLLDPATYPWLTLYPHISGLNYWIPGTETPTQWCMVLPSGLLCYNIYTTAPALDYIGPGWSFGLYDVRLTNANDAGESLVYRTPFADLVDGLGIEPQTHTERVFEQNEDWFDPADGFPADPGARLGGQTLRVRYVPTEAIQEWAAAQGVDMWIYRRQGVGQKLKYTAGMNAGYVCDPGPPYPDPGGACTNVNQNRFDALTITTDSTLDTIDGTLESASGQWRHVTTFGGDITPSAIAVDQSSHLFMNQGSQSETLTDGARFSYAIDYVDLRS